ncbi:unnamed protein product [Enterobius vermicularis]|uniref:PHD-type domain-containing protein n=1 Tax=Enterobius vermicularis TaxID=51028 RepID=A0A158Q9T9_ENTVE|nr:unnamed protein product [Enterobius vermicularis]
MVDARKICLQFEHAAVLYLCNTSHVFAASEIISKRFSKGRWKCVYAANTVLCAKAGPLRMRRANSVIQQDRMRKRNDVLLENALFSRRRKLDFKDQSRTDGNVALNATYEGEGLKKLQNVPRYSLRGHISDDGSPITKKHALISAPKQDLDIRVSKLGASLVLLGRKRRNSALLKKRRRRKHIRISAEESFACSDSLDGKLHVKKKKLYTVNNGEQCAEMYKTDFRHQDDGSDSSSDDDDFVRIKDRWKEDWNQGVQVIIYLQNIIQMNSFRPDRLIAVHNRKYVDDHFVRTTMPPLCQYQCDQADLAFLKLLNKRRFTLHLPHIELKQFALIMEQFEVSCYQAIHHDLLAPIIRRRDADRDEETCCEICGQADYEEDDPIVFCESCMVPVHQSCYGVEVLPKGDWICDVCNEFDFAPVCVFCPFSGGPMKVTEDGDTWSHISCALWIPEVRFGNHVRREPITKVDDVPNGRWNLSYFISKMSVLRCSVCDTSVGACIQCSDSSCTTAFHVTCALREKYVMHAVLKKIKYFCGDLTFFFTSYRIKIYGILVGVFVAENKRTVEKMEEDFFLYVSPEVIARHLNINEGLVDELYEYWKLKRADNGNRMVLTDRSELEFRVTSELSMMVKKKLRVDCELRHDLEKVRNLCHMVMLRERKKTQMFVFLRDAYNIIFDCIAKSHVPLSGRVLQEYREKLEIPYFNESLKSYFSDGVHSSKKLEKLLSQTFESEGHENTGEILRELRTGVKARTSLRRKSVTGMEVCDVTPTTHKSLNLRRRLNPLNLTF